MVTVITLDAAIIIIMGRLPTYRLSMLFVKAELSTELVRETSPCLEAHGSILPTLQLNPEGEDKEVFPFPDFFFNSSRTSVASLTNISVTTLSLQSGQESPQPG